MIKRYAGLLADIDRLPAPEAKAANKALRRIKTKRPSRAGALDAVSLIIRAAARGHAKRPQDKANDHAARTLVGARLPREDVDRYRAAAAEEGVSLYRWTATALESAYQRHRATYGGTP